MKNLSIDFINKCFPNVYIITKDIGDRGYFVMYKNYDLEYEYEYITKTEIASCLTRYMYNERKKKLLTLKILNE